MKQQTEIEGWKARCADLEKRLGNEEAKVKELREEVVRGRKAIDGVRVAASVSHYSQLVHDHSSTDSTMARRRKRGSIRLKRN